MKPSQHIANVIHKQPAEQIIKNRLRLKVTIESVRWLILQACAFRGHDEIVISKNRDNFIELIKYIAKWNEKVAEVVLENALQNAKYTSHEIQKEILHILTNKVRTKIREEVGNANFCILVDEAKDASNREQMTIVLRFVDKDGFVRERFFEIVRVGDTYASTLKNEISVVLTNNDLQNKMRGQGYDGASNMRGAWNGLEALFLRDCPYAYYVHCFAHRLQLALVAALKDVAAIWEFFSTLNSIINLTTGSSKRHDKLQSTQADDIAHMLDTGERETGTWANQICTLHHPGATRWSSHFDSVSDLIDMYNAICTIIRNLIKVGSNNSTRGEAKGIFKAMKSHEFIFVMHLVEHTIGVTDSLCRALQNKSQDILSAMNLVRSTKSVIPKIILDGWDNFFKKVESFCKKYDIDVLDMNAPYKFGTGRSCQQHDHITVGHYYQFDIFNDTIDFQLQELNSRCSDETIELLILSSALDPSNGFKSFKIDYICKLAEKFYPTDFTLKELRLLGYQLELFEAEVHQAVFPKMSTISELRRVLIETHGAKILYLIDRLIRLVLTLLVFMATIE